MPTLDRRITLRIEAPGAFNEHDEFVPGTVTAYPLWAMRVDSRASLEIQSDQASSLFTTDRVTRTYRVRWFNELAMVADEPGQVRVDDPDLDQLIAVAIVEAKTLSGIRRRFMDITATSGLR